ncbi:MAG: hypothetical protein K2Q06_09205 [Parvularculaceae bacterium]|nr:hypothetical protein [Parvularculaceae bacterium]
MSRPIFAGGAYAILVFAVGFVLGAVRTLILEPKVGATTATLLELPLMLLASWIACGFVIARLRVPADAATRLAMGLVAFAVLMTAEALLGVLLMRLTVEGFLARFSTLAGGLGLAAQIAFAAFPLVRRRG